MVRVLVADDEALVRGGLRLLLHDQNGIEVVAEAADGAEALTAACEHRPDVVLMDIRMPEVDGITAVRNLREAGLECRVLMLTAFDTDEFLLDAFAAGADGFLLKSEHPDVIERAVLEPTDGASTLSAPVLRRLVGLAAIPPTRPAVPAQVSEREWEVARRVAEGSSNAEIAAVLHLSEATVKTHIGNLFTKLDLVNRVQLAVLVLQHEHGFGHPEGRSGSPG